MEKIKITVGLLFILVSFASSAQPCNGKLDEEWIREHYSKREVMIPMHDGASLSTAIYEPRTVPEGGSPIIIIRTPYGLSPYGEDKYSNNLSIGCKNYVSNGYIIVYQSVRGTHLSEGEFVNVRPVISDSPSWDGEADDASDSYDTIEWLLANTDNNGRVGVKGVSYPGFYATIAALSHHPALKAASPQAPVTDWWRGDDFHHNGELMLADFYSFGGGFLPTRKCLSTNGGKTPVQGIRVDTCIYDYFLQKGSLAEIMKPFGDSLVFVNDIINHPDRDSFWEEREPTAHFSADMPAMLIVGGLFDAEDFYGPFRTYREMLKVRSEDTYFVQGPWYHGAWTNFNYNHLDNAWFGNGSAEWYLDNIEYPFFAYYLENKGDKPAPVWVLPSGETDPSLMKDRNCAEMWEAMDEWPSLNEGRRRFSSRDKYDGRRRFSSDKYEGRRRFSSDKYYICMDGKISSNRPSGRRKGRSYISDPASPVPYFHKVYEQKKRDRDYMAGDQSFVENRSDVLTYEAGVQEDTLYLLGPVKVHLRLLQSSPDADYIVKIIDERPDGYQMLVRADVMPARYRKGFEKPCWARPRKTFSLDFTMPDVAHRLMPGHRLLIQVQSSWFPLVAMNPQTEFENYYKVGEDSYKSAEITVLNGSYVEIPRRWEPLIAVRNH